MQNKFHLFKSDLDRMSLIRINFKHNIDRYIEKILFLARDIKSLTKDVVNSNSYLLDVNQNQIRSCVVQTIQRFEGIINNSISLFEKHNYKKMLSHGYTILRGRNMKIITSVIDVHCGDNLQLEFKDGIVNVEAK